MVQRIKTIDAIARERRTDTMFIAMVNRAGEATRDHPAIAEATTWLTEEGLGWEICAGFQRGFVSLEGGSRVIFIDAPYAPGSRTLARLEARFEREDGTPRTPGIILALLTLDEAMSNAEQDDPVFWDHF